MSINHQRRRGATLLFRRKIPSDLRDRFGSCEIVRSIGRATPGEARRLANQLWSRTETVFMRVRGEPGLTRPEIGQVVNAAVDRFRDDTERTLADIRPGVPLAPLDEPLNLTFKMKGKEALLKNLLARNDVSALSQMTRSWSTSVLGKDVEHESLDERRLGRALIQALAAEMPGAGSAFEALSRRRHAVSPEILSEGECEIEPDDLAALYAAKPGDDLSGVLRRIEARIGETSQQPKTAPLHAPIDAALRNGTRLMSELWPEFCDNKITMNEWKTNEKAAARTTLKLLINVCGDRRPSDYSSLDVARFHRLYKQLPCNYYHNGYFRTIYEGKGIEALAEETKDLHVPRTTAKSWNSHNSPLHGFFLWSAGKGCAIAKGTASICKDEFVKIPKKRGPKKWRMAVEGSMSVRRSSCCSPRRSFVGAGQVDPGSSPDRWSYETIATGCC